MNPSNELFELIKSLSKSEKGHFRKFTNMHVVQGGNNYMKLFAAIDKQNSYDETKIKLTLKNTSFIKQFAFYKHYLYQIILESLFSYYKNASIDFSIIRNNGFIEVLKSKGLYQQCLKLAKKQKTVLNEAERYIDHLNIIKHQKRLDYLQKNFPVDKVFEEESRILESLKVENQYWKLQKKAFQLGYYYGMIRDSSQLKSFKRILANTLLSDPGKAITFDSQIRYYYVQGLVSRIKGDPEKSNQIWLKIIALVESGKFYKKRNPMAYISLLHNVLLSNLETKSMQSFFSNLKLLETIESKIPIVLVEKFITRQLLLLTYHIHTGKFLESTMVMNETEEGMSNFKAFIGKGRLLDFYYSIAYISMALENYKDALKWLNHILNSVEHKKNVLYRHALLMQLIIHFELGNLDIEEYLVKSTYRYLRNEHLLFRYEELILEFIRTELPVIVKEEQLMEAMKRLKANIIRELKEPYQAHVIESFDILSWLDSKIQNRSFIDVYRENKLRKIQQEIH